MQSARYAGRLQASRIEGQQAGVGSTPTFLINGRLYPGGGIGPLRHAEGDAGFAPGQAEPVACVSGWRWPGAPGNRPQHERPRCASSSLGPGAGRAFARRPSGSSTATSAPARCTPSRSASARPHGIPPTRENVLGVLSLILWSLNFVVSYKYIAQVMRADNRGEGRDPRAAGAGERLATGTPAQWR